MKLLVAAILVVQLISGLVVWYDLKSTNVEPCKLPGASTKPKSNTNSSKRKILAKPPQQMGSADTLEVTRR